MNVEVSTRGVETWSSTCEGVGYTRDEVLAESDALVAALRQKYPVPKVA